MNPQDESSLAHGSQTLMLPCFAAAGTKIFAPTADQRLLIGSAEFLRTHFPVTLHQQVANRTTTLTEDTLLENLLKDDGSLVGNRVFVLYGAAGSGKSELLRWLQIQTMLHNPNRATVTTRITRTELDVFHLAQRLKHLYTAEAFPEDMLQRWEEARHKPRTLAKILVLTALEQLLTSDDQINALYYQLIDVVQTNLERCFASMAEPTEDIGQFIELFSREDLTDILRNSVIPIPLAYETLRYYILKGFRDHLLAGLDLPILLKQIAQHVQKEYGQRPILLVDDLVQSVNLFATDLLDYFITLEDGCWDVVIGITPNSLASTLRGKELLDRIAHLDTIDDRVQKLWLSDEYGLSSTFLYEANCVEYARLYLSEYKRHNKQPCNATCLAFRCCTHLEPDRQTNILAPFNKNLLMRLFRSLPAGKGKVRYFTLYLRDILQRIAQGEEFLIVLQEYVKSELAVYHPNEFIAQMYELYGAVVTHGQTQPEAECLTHLYRFFDIVNSPETLQLPVVISLQRKNDVMIHTASTSQEASFILDPGKETIKAWLRGEVVNKQQLRNIRRGVVKAIKDCYMLDTMTRPHVSKPSRILRWGQTRLDTVPPVQLEHVDDFLGVFVPQTIGSLAYMLHDFADAASWSEQNLRSEILAHEAFPLLLFQANAYRDMIHNELEHQLGITVEEFAFSLLLFATFFGRCPIELPLYFKEKMGILETQPCKYPVSVEGERPRLSSGQTIIIRRLFEDSFKLRENVFDGLLLEKMMAEISLKRAFDLLRQIPCVAIHSDFRLNDEALGTFVNGIQEKISVLIRLQFDQRVKIALIQVCQDVIETNENVLTHLPSLQEVQGHGERRVTEFLEMCHPCELHHTLVEAAIVETACYEQSLMQLQNILTELNTSHTLLAEGKNVLSSFTRAEADVLVGFTQHDFSMSVAQIEDGLLSKIAYQLPELYKRLEIRVQRG